MQQQMQQQKQQQIQQQHMHQHMQDQQGQQQQQHTRQQVQQQAPAQAQQARQFPQQQQAQQQGQQGYAPHAGRGVRAGFAPAQVLAEAVAPQLAQAGPVFAVQGILPDQGQQLVGEVPGQLAGGLVGVPSHFVGMALQMPTQVGHEQP